MIDTSDGLMRDAARIAAASGVVLDLDPDALAPGDRTCGRRPARSGPAGPGLGAGRRARTTPCSACFPPGAVVPGGFRAVGAVREPSGPGVTVAGRAWSGPDGWRHFGPANAVNPCRQVRRQGLDHAGVSA